MKKAGSVRGMQGIATPRHVSGLAMTWKIAGQCYKCAKVIHRFAVWILALICALSFVI